MRQSVMDVLDVTTVSQSMGVGWRTVVNAQRGSAYGCGWPVTGDEERRSGEVKRPKAGMEAGVGETKDRQERQRQRPTVTQLCRTVDGQ